MKTKYKTECQRALKITEPDKCERLSWANNYITDFRVLTAIQNKDPVSLQCIITIDTESLISTINFPHWKPSDSVEVITH